MGRFPQAGQGPMTHFLPGDYVEAMVTDQPCEGAGIMRGGLYLIDEVEPELFRKHPCSGCGDACRGDGVQLVSPRLPYPYVWCSSSFRLIYRPDGRAMRRALGLKRQRTPHS